MVLGLVTLRSTEVGAVSVAWLVVSLPPSSFRHALLLVTQQATVYHTIIFIIFSHFFHLTQTAGFLPVKKRYRSLPVAGQGEPNLYDHNPAPGRDCVTV